MKGLEKIKRHRRQILAIAARYGAESLAAFGSVVRGEDRPDSDLDFLVRMVPGYDLCDMLALTRELEALLQQKTDVVTQEELSPYMKDRILNEAILL